jgi:hypothetical protein
LDGTYRQVFFKNRIQCQQYKSGVYLFQILALAEAIEENRKAHERAAASLSCATHIIIQLIQMWRDLSSEEFAILEASLIPTVDDNGSQV